MTTLLTSTERATLRRQGQTIKPVIFVGKSGLSPEVIASTADALRARNLIKVRVLRESPIGRDDVAKVLTEATGAQCPGRIGHTFLLYLAPKETDEGSD